MYFLTDVPQIVEIEVEVRSQKLEVETASNYWLRASNFELPTDKKTFCVTSDIKYLSIISVFGQTLFCHKFNKCREASKFIKKNSYSVFLVESNFNIWLQVAICRLFGKNQPATSNHNYF
ncbi:MAG: hypothetical protein A2275_16590 [Bacteroidetes bacterium RIFOXYA12_FULL_35_11]|nr:MAG: hypothetical protein A2X01_11905 [Bacteroidetes bacterium GWF2_35_48]OFY72373.1 MAG: hypothetical protein A2275_16590 [Bacteroidetes bacterium RIFOXYA12_FULL_35_11]OFZ03050.1 MAG: hypothetical protein A2491_01625 [Bacteroidetes bacterium RIFOXYC12_FULL_35_7]HBX49531.1 hypothetical protein [Bacteroidales bacterium]